MNSLPTLVLKTEKLENEILDGLQKGFAATFCDAPTTETHRMSVEFARAAAPIISNAIKSYIESLTLTIPVISVNVPSPMGPLVGVSNGPVSIGTVG